MKAFLSIILAVAVSISTAMAKHGGHGGHRGHGGYHGKHGKHYSSVSARGGRNSAAANRQNTHWAATGAAETGEAVIGRRLGNGGYWGGGSRFIFIGGGYPYYWNWYPYWGWRYPYAYCTAIILRICTLTTVAPYQDTDTLGPEPSWFPAPASPGNCASGIPAVKSHYGFLKAPIGTYIGELAPSAVCGAA